jgi:hypothetical protein
VGSLTSHNPIGLQGLLRGYLYFYIYLLFILVLIDFTGLSVPHISRTEWWDGDNELETCGSKRSWYPSTCLKFQTASLMRLRRHDATALRENKTGLSWFLTLYNAAICDTIKLRFHTSPTPTVRERTWVVLLRRTIASWRNPPQGTEGLWMFQVILGTIYSQIPSTCVKLWVFCTATVAHAMTAPPDTSSNGTVSFCQ